MCLCLTVCVPCLSVCLLARLPVDQLGPVCAPVCVCAPLTASGDVRVPLLVPHPALGLCCSMHRRGKRLREPACSAQAVKHLHPMGEGRGSSLESKTGRGSGNAGWVRGGCCWWLQAGVWGWGPVRLLGLRTVSCWSRTHCPAATSRSSVAAGCSQRPLESGVPQVLGLPPCPQEWRGCPAWRGRHCCGGSGRPGQNTQDTRWGAPVARPPEGSPCCGVAEPPAQCGRQGA